MMKLADYSDEFDRIKKQEEETLKILSQKEYSSPEEILNTVGKSIKNFASGYEQSDDITMLSIKYIGFGDE